MKSLEVSVLWPAWMWLIDPALKMIFCSYSDSLSIEHSEIRRLLITSEWYQQIAGTDVQLTVREKRKLVNVAGGAMRATSVGGSITGKGGNVIVLDDGMDPDMAFSDAERKSAIRWINQSLMNRLNDKKRDKIVIVMHRLHEEDPCGNAESKSKDWVKLSIPCPATETVEYVSPRTEKKIVYKEGDLLWPEREGQKEVDEQRVYLGPWAFGAQYQQSPSPLGGGILKRDWFRYYEPADLPDPMMMIVSSWDLTFKDTGDSKVCGQIWGISGVNRYLLDRVARKMDFLETLKAIQNLNERWNPDVTLVEDKANGPATITVLKNAVPGLVPIDPGKSSKQERCHAISGQVEAGNALLPKDAHWVESFLKTVCTFPAGKETDDVDTMTQTLQYCSGIGTTKVGLDDIVAVPGVAAELSW
jgi:predicted phage terminase large subunit-like protein